MYHPTDRIVHTTAFVTQVVEYWLEQLSDNPQYFHRCSASDFNSDYLLIANCSLIVHTDRRKEIVYLTTHSTHFIYGYMASDIWLRTSQIAREEICCHHMGYSFQLTARVLLHAPSHRQDNIYHSLCYTSHAALYGMTYRQ